MKNIHSITFRNGSKEELLPGFEPDFPYIASRAELDKYPGHFVPWHWHKEVELFFMERGALDYYTPRGKITFPQGSGGLVNSNLLHMTKSRNETENTIQLVHIFDTNLIGGQQGSRIEQKYILPLITASQIDVVALSPDNSAHQDLLKTIRASFQLSDEEYAYEVKLRAVLADIWCQFFKLSIPRMHEKGGEDKASEKLKLMMIHIHEHFAQKIRIEEIAAAAFTSERECFRTFRDCLRMTPMEYLKDYRLRASCNLLINTRESITAISYSCGFGSSSYFAKIFHSAMGCTPFEYRQRWQNFNKSRQISYIL